MSLSIVLVTYNGLSSVSELLSMQLAYNTKSFCYLLKLEAYRTIFSGVRKDSLGKSVKMLIITVLLFLMNEILNHFF